MFDLLRLNATAASMRAFILVFGSTALKRPLECDCKEHMSSWASVAGTMFCRLFDAPPSPSENPVMETKGRAVMLRRKFLRGIPSTGNGPRLAMAVLLVWTTAVEPMLAQTAQQTPSSEAAVVGQVTPQYSIEDLSYLLEPIALYPDPLLALILSASTFPVQIVEAERWIAFNPISVRRGDFSEVDAMDWDSSVKALARFPDVIRMLADHLDWTESLGTAVAAQTSDVTTAIQLLRAKAETLGNLKSTPEQTVTARDEGGSRIIYVSPANPERIYVPVYDPRIVFSSSAAGAIAFGVGVLVGSAWSNRWGWNNRRWNQIWITPPVWHPPPPTWRPPHRPGAGHRGPGDRIARVIGLNAPAVSRSVPAGLAVVLKLRMFGRSVRVVLVVVLKFRVVGLNAPARVRRLRTFGRSAPVVLVRLPKSQAFDLNGLQLVPRILVVQCVLVVHNDPAMQLAQVAGIGIRLVRVRVSPRDNNPAMQRGRVVDIVTISQRGKRSRRRDLGRRRRREPERSPARDKETRASAIALRGEGDLSRSENARCQTLASG